MSSIDYMAPERFTNGPIDTGVDVYALFPDGVNHVHLDVKPVP